MRLHRTLAFRLTALYVLLFALSVFILFSVVWVATERAMTAQIADSVCREAISLADEFRATNAATAAILIDRRLRRGRTEFYLLQDRYGSYVAGNISPVVPVIGGFASQVRLIADNTTDTSSAAGEIRTVLGFGVLLEDGTFVLAGDDIERVESTKRAFLAAFVAAGVASTVLAILGGLILSRGFLHRIDAINRTATEIVTGRLNSRIPARSPPAAASESCPRTR